MKVEIIKENGILTATPFGRVDSINSDEIDAKIKNQLTTDIKEIVIDMREVDFISSKGIRIFLGLRNIVINNGKFSLININNSVREVLELSDLLNIFNVK